MQSHFMRHELNYKNLTAQKEFREANRLEIYMVCTSVSETYLLTQIKSINNLNEHTFQHNMSKK